MDDEEILAQRGELLGQTIVTCDRCGRVVTSVAPTPDGERLCEECSRPVDADREPLPPPDDEP